MLVVVVGVAKGPPLGRGLAHEPIRRDESELEPREGVGTRSAPGVRSPPSARNARAGNRSGLLDTNDGWASTTSRSRRRASCRPCVCIHEEPASSGLPTASSKSVWRQNSDSMSSSASNARAPRPGTLDSMAAARPRRRRPPRPRPGPPARTAAGSCGRRTRSCDGPARGGRRSWSARSAPRPSPRARGCWRSGPVGGLGCGTPWARSASPQSGCRSLAAQRTPSSFGEAARSRSAGRAAGRTPSGGGADPRVVDLREPGRRRAAGSRARTDRRRFVGRGPGDAADRNGTSSARRTAVQRLEPAGSKVGLRRRRKKTVGCRATTRLPLVASPKASAPRGEDGQCPTPSPSRSAASSTVPTRPVIVWDRGRCQLDGSARPALQRSSAMSRGGRPGSWAFAIGRRF